MPKASKTKAEVVSLCYKLEENGMKHGMQKLDM